MPTRALSEEAKARPEAQLLAGALLAQSSDGRPSPFIQVPASPLSSSTLQALQQSSQQFGVREQSAAEEAADRPARELKRTLASLTRETPDTTTTTLVETPDQTVTRTVTETVTVPGQESAGVNELRSILGRAANRAGAIEDRGDGRFSDRYIDRLAGYIERAGDRLLDSLESAVDRGGRRTERRVERTLDSLGEAFARTIDRLFDRGGDRGVSAFDEVVQQNAARVVRVFGKVLEATGDDVSRRLESLLVKAGPEAIRSLQAAADRVRPTTTTQVTHQETDVIPGGVEVVTTTIPGSSATSTAAVETPLTPTEARAEVRRQVEAYASASSLLAPLQELASPPPLVPNPAAGIERPPLRSSEDRDGADRDDRGPIVRESREDDDRRTRQPARTDVRRAPEERTFRPPIAIERTEAPTPTIGSLAPPIGPAEDTASPPGTLIEIAA